MAPSESPVSDAPAPGAPTGRGIHTYPRRGLHGLLVHRFGLEIVSGRLQPGELLPSDGKFDGEHVSRTVLREATRVLAAKGLVEARQKTGTRVRPRSEWNLLDPDVLAWRLESDSSSYRSLFRDITELRLIIEPAAARLAAQRATPAEVTALESCFAAMKAAQGDPDAYLAPDLRFHQTILTACHNETIEQVGLALRGLFRVSFSFSLSMRPRDAPLHTLALHEEILDAIREGNLHKAEESMTALITRTAALVDSSPTGMNARMSGLGERNGELR